MLTGTGLTPSGSSTVHIYTKTLHRTTQVTTPRTTQLTTNLEECGPCPVFGICLTTEENARKNLNQGSRSVRVGTIKTEYTEQNIHNKKNT